MVTTPVHDKKNTDEIASINAFKNWCLYAFLGVIDSSLLLEKYLEQMRFHYLPIYSTKKSLLIVIGKI